MKEQSLLYGERAQVVINAYAIRRASGSVAAIRTPCPPRAARCGR